MAPHSNTLAWKIPWMEEPGRLQSMWSLRVGHDWATSLSLFTFMLWRRKWQPTPVFLPGEFQGQRSLVGCHLWGCTESDMTEATWRQQQQQQPPNHQADQWQTWDLILIQMPKHTFFFFAWFAELRQGFQPGPLLPALGSFVLWFPTLTAHENHLEPFNKCPRPHPYQLDWNLWSGALV